MTGRHPNRFFSHLILTILLTCSGIWTPGQTLDNQNSLALIGGTVYVNPMDAPIHEGVIVIREGKIVAVGRKRSVRIPPDSREIDCSGLIITAGFWNSHVHFFERKWAKADSIPATELAQQIQDAFTRFGFTSVFDLSSEWVNTKRIRERIESGEVSGPKIYSTGEGLIPPGAMPSDAVLNFMGLMKTRNPEIGDETQAVAESKRLLAEGVAGLKLFASSQSGTPMSETAIRAITAEAHKLGKPVFVHPNSGADILVAIRNGVDVIAHTTPRSGPWDAKVLDSMKAAAVALTPTLTLWAFYLRHERVSTRSQIVNAALGQLRSWSTAGGVVLFGTDLGAVDPDPTEEYILMSHAGMSFRQILASLTTAPAVKFGQAAQVGRIAVGLQADLVVLNQDPAKDIRSLASVKYTLRAGKIIYQATPDKNLKLTSNR